MNFIAVKRNPEAKVFLFLAFVATVVLMLVSPDSYMYDLWNHSDSAWFYMSGKAWMSGMRPYVDFADSKGPLLWLIYGVGYLISPTDYIGVFWISCLVYAVTYYCIYRMAHLLLGNRSLAVAVSVLMSLSFFYPYVHHEIRCEDFNQMLMAIVLRLVFNLLYGHHEDAGSQVRKVSLGIGLCAAASLLIKYNVTPMLAFPMLFVLHWSWKRGCGIVKPILWCLLGVAIVTLPMMAYLWATGCFPAFIQEYFVNTLTVVGDSHASMGGVLARFMGHWIPLSLLLAIGLVGTVMLVFCLNRYRLFPLAMFLVVVLLTVTHATWTFHYGTCLIFPAFALMALAKMTGRRLGEFFRKPVAAVIVSLLAVVATAAVNWHKQGDSLFFKRDVRSADLYRFAAMMSHVKNPRVVYYFTGPYPEYGIQLHSLPACVYWASQSGSTEKMDQFQRDIAREGKADFFFAQHGSKAGEKLEKAMGYHRYESSPVKGEQYRLDLFSRQPLEEPAPFMPSPLDILLKRNPFKENR